jgi:hypothetical protein
MFFLGSIFDTEHIRRDRERQRSGSDAAGDDWIATIAKSEPR